MRGNVRSRGAAVDQYQSHAALMFTLMMFNKS